jgi:hypothetical protein
LRRCSRPCQTELCGLAGASDASLHAIDACVDGCMRCARARGGPGNQAPAPGRHAGGHAVCREKGGGGPAGAAGARGRRACRVRGGGDSRAGHRHRWGWLGGLVGWHQGALPGRTRQAAHAHPRPCRHVWGCHVQATPGYPLGRSFLFSLAAEGSGGLMGAVGRASDRRLCTRARCCRGSARGWVGTGQRWQR